MMHGPINIKSLRTSASMSFAVIELLVGSPCIASYHRYRCGADGRFLLTDERSGYDFENSSPFSAEIENEGS